MTPEGEEREGVTYILTLRCTAAWDTMVHECFLSIDFAKAFHSGRHNYFMFIILGSPHRYL